MPLSSSKIYTKPIAGRQWPPWHSNARHQLITGHPLPVPRRSAIHYYFPSGYNFGTHGTADSREIVVSKNLFYIQIVPKERLVFRLTAIEVPPCPCLNIPIR